MSSNEKMTPMLTQFYEAKSKYPDSILFFRMGDFYEMFGEDAKVASKILGIALTSRNKSDNDALPMCGIPYHAYQPYLTKLIQAGHKVAICEQLEDPKQVKGIVKRGVVRVITPGTVIDDEALKGSDFNFILAVYKQTNTYYAAIADTSTGDLMLCKESNLNNLIGKWQPREIIANIEIDELNSSINFCKINLQYHLSTLKNNFMRHFNISSEKAVGIDDDKFIYTVNMLFEYFEANLLEISLKKPVLITNKDEMYLDSIAVSTLEIIKSANQSSNSSLFSVLNNCKTGLGERLLKRWLISPIRSTPEIDRRLNMIQFFYENHLYTKQLFQMLSDVYDIERIITRITAKRSNAKDLVWLKLSIKNLPEIFQLFKDSANPVINDFMEEFDPLEDIYRLIDTAITDEPPNGITDGGIIKKGYDTEVDSLKAVKTDGGEILARIEADEKEKTQINNLKIKYNKVFGYYFEISNTNLNKVPDYFQRKQTLVNAERFITPELKEVEDKLLNADERMCKYEYEVFIKIRDEIERNRDRIRLAASKIAELDLFSSIGWYAYKNSFVRPDVGDYEEIKIIDGRHPVVERFCGDQFVPNDILLDNLMNNLIIITGPNMSGKSTYIRMTAIITLMAHAGLFVPAKSAKIALVDRIFTRVGASDNLARGESTFMVEMLETANILNNATDKSLIILDEIGRGTSTFDGVSIAWAVAEYILKKIGAKTLFATHYHELTDISYANYGAKNYTVEVKEWNGEVIFLRKIIEGSADRSYGIYVGKLAGLPLDVIEKSEEILSKLEKNEFGADGIPKLAKSVKRKSEKVVQPLLIFEENPVIDELRSINIDDTTPIQALMTLKKLKEMAENG